MSSRVLQNSVGGIASSVATRAFREIPGPPSYPVVGSLLQYKLGPLDKFKYHEALHHFFRTYGPLVRENIGRGKTIVHVFDLDDIKTVYSHEGKWPVIPPLQETTQLYRSQKKMSLGLGNTNGEEWYKLRTNSQQLLLRPKEVQRHLPSVNSVAADFVRRLEDVRCTKNDEVNDLKAEVGKWSLENAGMIVFDTRLGCLAEDTEELGRQLVEANKQIFKYSGILKFSLPVYKYVSTPMWRKLVHAEDFFYGHALRAVDDTILRLRDAVESSQLKEGRFYLLSYLLAKTDLSLKDVTIICLSLFSDGLSTTTPTVLFNLYCFATNPRAQEKVYKEIQNVMGSAQEVTESHIAKMPYLKAFVKETFRLWPNGTEVSRYTEQAMVLSGYEIPPGTHVDLNPSVHFRDPNIFQDPDVHRPERWLRAGGGGGGVADDSAAAHDEYDVEAKIHPYLLTPFGHGTRMCAGRRFAEQDLHILLTMIVRRFKLEYPVGEKMGQVYNTLLFPDRPVRVKFMKRP